MELKHNANINKIVINTNLKLKYIIPHNGSSNMVFFLESPIFSRNQIHTTEYQQSC